jgi:hypothetical protein
VIIEKPWLKRAAPIEKNRDAGIDEVVKEVKEVL